MALLERRPILSGLCFGALCYKPHFGLLIPVALIAGGHWRAMLAAAAASLTLVATSAVLFGVATWSAFLTAILGSGDIYAGHAIFMGGLTSPYGALLASGASRGLAVAVQAMVTVLAATVVALVWRSPVAMPPGTAMPPGAAMPPGSAMPAGAAMSGGGHARAAMPVRAAVLLAATPVAVPVLMFYDLMLVLVALVWLSRVPETIRTPWRIALTAAVFLGPLASGNLSTQTHWMLAFLTAVAAFALSLTVAWRAAPPRLVTGAA